MVVKEVRDEFSKFLIKQRNSETFEFIETMQTLDSKRRDLFYKLEINKGNTTPTSGGRSPGGTARASSILQSSITETEWIQLQEMFENISNNYIKENSKKEIALEPRVRNSILQQIQGQQNTTSELLSPRVQLLAKYEHLLKVDMSKAVYVAMMQLQQDSLHAFVHSSEFHNFLNKFKPEEKSMMIKLLTTAIVFQPTNLLWKKDEESIVNTPESNINTNGSKHQPQKSRNSLYLLGSPLHPSSTSREGWDQNISLSSFLYTDKMLKEDPFISEREFQWLHYMIEDHSIWKPYFESESMDKCSIFTSPLQFLVQSKNNFSKILNKYGLIKLEVFLPFHYDTVSRAMMTANFQEDYFCTSKSEIKDVLQGMPLNINYDEGHLNHMLYGLDRKCHTLLKQVQYHLSGSKRNCQVATSIKLLPHLDRMYFVRKSCKFGPQQSTSILQKNTKFSGLIGTSLSKIGEHETKLTYVMYGNIGNVSHHKQLSSTMVHAFKKVSQEFYHFYMQQLTPMVNIITSTEEDAPSSLEEQLKVNPMDEQYRKHFESMEWNFFQNGRKMEQQVYQENPKLYYPTQQHKISTVSVAI